MKVVSYSETGQITVSRGESLHLDLEVQADTDEDMVISFIVLLGPDDIARSTKDHEEYIHDLMAKLVNQNNELRPLSARVTELEALVAEQAAQLTEASS